MFFPGLYDTLIFDFNGKVERSLIARFKCSNCFCLFLLFQDKLARHRWLISFTFGEQNTATHEYKKLSTLLKDHHIQV